MLILLIPAGAAALYAAGSLGLKRAMAAGASPRQVLVLSTLILGGFALPLWFIFPGRWELSGILAAVAAGIALFVGRFFAVKALEKGDLSVVVPLLGMKTLFVALGSAFTGATSVDGRLIFAAALASAGVALLQRAPRQEARSMGRAILFAGAASALFAVTDVITQSYARSVGVGVFQPVLMLTLCLCLPFLGGTFKLTPKLSAGARRPMTLGSILIGFQTTLVILTIGLSGQATLVNIIYSTRALWSVGLDCWQGGETARLFWVSRLGGAVLLTGAIVLALLGR